MTIPTAPIRAALTERGLLVETRGLAPDAVTAVTDDSRRVSTGTLFVAVRGSTSDGHAFLADAAARGMALAVVEDPTTVSGPCWVVRESRRAVAVVGQAAFGFPAERLELIGVTGTSGKTTTVSMLRHVLGTSAVPAASIGTLGVLLGSAGDVLPGGAGLTTPGPLELQRVLRLLVDCGVKSVAMEVSSHALDQHRVDGVAFDVALFTNLSRDHLDYHGSMDAYRDAKARLLGHLRPTGTAVVNADDAAWQGLALPARVLRFSLDPEHAADVRADDVQYTAAGSEWTLRYRAQAARVQLPLIGDFNVANALAAAAGAIARGRSVDAIARALSTLPQVPGRLERISTAPTVLRDYAHKPDALERALAAVRPFTPARLIVVFGCGGDRDRGKRPIMGEIAERLADVVILTSDNPRTEDPHAILDEIEAGMRGQGHVKIEDRRTAIAHALDLATPQDVILLAGKGHETYQIRGAESFPFDEKAVVAELTAGRGVRSSP